MQDLHPHLVLLTERNQRGVFVSRKGQNTETALSICFALSMDRGHTKPTSKGATIQLLPREWHSASSLQSFESCLWASPLCIDGVCASVSKICSKYQEKPTPSPKKKPKRGYFWGSGDTEKVFHINEWWWLLCFMSLWFMKVFSGTFYVR